MYLENEFHPFSADSFSERETKMMGLIMVHTVTSLESISIHFIKSWFLVNGLRGHVADLLTK